MRKASSENIVYDFSNFHVIFRLGEHLLAAPVRQVREVTPYQLPVPVPRAPEFVAGLVNHHGRLYVLVELARFLNLRVSGERPRHLVLLSRDDVSLGFPCDGVLRIAPMPESHREPVVITDDGPVLVIDADEALTGLESYFG